MNADKREGAALQVEVLLAGEERGDLMRRLMELYLYDFSEYDGNDVDEAGIYGDLYLERYCQEAGRYPFWIRVEGHPAGLALVNRHVLLPGCHWSMAEFFVMRKYRRQGVGRKAAFTLLDRFACCWEVREMPANKQAVDFWHRVITEYTGGQLSETWWDSYKWRGPVQTFESRSGAAPGQVAAAG